jgi:rhamnose transport system permease protein
VRQAPAERGTAGLRSLASRWETLLVGLLLVTVVVGQSLSPEFLTTDSFTTGSLDFSEVALMAIALTLVIVAAEIDLSVASVLALSSALMADLWNRGLPLELIMPICLVAGALCGAFNGVLVTRLGLPSLAVTIGTLALFRGLAYVVIGDESVTDFPPAWTDLAFGNFAGTFIPNTMVLFALIAVVFGVLLHATPFGRAIYAIGANEEAAYFSGLRVKRIKLILFTLSGLVAALAGIVISLRNSTAAANVGQGFELTAITAVLLGGVSIFGGRGTIVGVILALALLGGIQKALLLSESISSYWIQIVTGALLVGSVLGPNIARRASETRRRRTSQHPEEGPKS